MNLIDLTVKDFVDKLASGTPAPGGGSAAALAGALGSGLCAMVAKLTSGSKKFSHVTQDMIQIESEADRLASRLLELTHLDTQAYEQVMAAYRMPKGTDHEKQTRKTAIQQAMKQAAKVPMDTLTAISEVIPLARTVLDKGNPNCMTDVGVAILLARAAAQGAAYNVWINLQDIDDEAFGSQLRTDSNQLLSKIVDAVETLSNAIEQKLQ